MTREMNKPDWCSYPYMCGNFGYTIYDTCKDCKHYKPKERTLDDWIKPFFDNSCRMEKIKR